MASIFTKIIKKELPAHVVAETDQYIAFLDNKPMAMGHTLVVLKKEIDYLFDIDDQTLGSMLVFAKHVGLAIQQVIPCQRMGIAAVGLEVPHAHMHLVPLNSAYDIDFSKPPLSCSQSTLADLATRIAAKVAL